MGDFQNIGNTYANLILDALLGDNHVAASASTWWLALSSTNPDAAGGNWTEPSGNGYVRFSFANTTANWSVANARGKQTNVDITMATPTGAGWGTLGYYGWWDAVTGGTFIIGGQLQVANTYTAGVTPYFPAGSIVVECPTLTV